MNEMNQSLKKDSMTVFGFWVYLMTDFVLFASLFAVYGVLHANTFGNAGAKDIFDAQFVLAETLILLASSFVIGLGLLAARAGKKWLVILLVLATAALGTAFLSMEFHEFAALIAAGHGPQQSGFLSAYFTLVGTHGTHILAGLLWAVALMAAIARRGLTQPNMRKLMLFSLFWHFLDIIWIFIFTFVYLLGIL